MAIAPVAARRGTILEAEREDDADEDIADLLPMDRVERAPEERRLSMVVIFRQHTQQRRRSLLLNGYCITTANCSRRLYNINGERHRHFSGRHANILCVCAERVLSVDDAHMGPENEV